LVKDDVQQAVGDMEGGSLYNVINDRVVNGNLAAGKKGAPQRKQPPLTIDDLQQPENLFCKDGYILFYE